MSKTQLLRNIRVAKSNEENVFFTPKIPYYCKFGRVRPIEIRRGRKGIALFDTSTKVTHFISSINFGVQHQVLVADFRTKIYVGILKKRYYMDNYTKGNVLYSNRAGSKPKNFHPITFKHLHIVSRYFVASFCFDPRNMEDENGSLNLILDHSYKKERLVFNRFTNES